jgi:hypothetical protein
MTAALRGAPWLVVRPRCSPRPTRGYGRRRPPGRPGRAAVAVSSLAQPTAASAFRITSVTAADWETMIACAPVTSTIAAPARSAIDRTTSVTDGPLAGPPREERVELGQTPTDGERVGDRMREAGLADAAPSRGRQDPHVFAQPSRPTCPAPRVFGRAKTCADIPQTESAFCREFWSTIQMRRAWSTQAIAPNRARLTFRTGAKECGRCQAATGWTYTTDDEDDVAVR